MAWQQYTWSVVAAVLLLILQATFIGVLLVARSKRNRAIAALQAAATVSEKTGEAFFRSLTEHLGSVLQADYVSIGELSACGSRIKTVAVSAGARSVGNLEYDLAHTPCQKVLELGRYAAHGDVQSRFPLPEILRQLDVHSYLGVALVDSAGSRMGAMSVLNRKPFRDVSIAEATLQVFAARASAEMERLRAERALEESRRFTERITKTIPNVVFIYDLTTRRNVYVNHRSWEVLGYTDEEVVEMGDSFLPRIMHPEDLATLPALAEQYARATDGEVFEHLFRMRHKNGEWRWVHRCATIFTKTPDGRPQQLIGTATDVTDLKKAEEELRGLSAHLLNVQDEGRRRIARELHDGTAQNLFAISLNLELLQQRGVPPEGVSVISDCQALCDASLKELRTLSYLLHPPMLDQSGIIPALRWFVEGFSKRSGIAVQLEVADEGIRLPMPLKQDLFRIVQEAMSNVVRHSGSPTALIRLERLDSNVILKIQDSGRGLAGNATPDKPETGRFQGVGISSMRERLRQIGGRLEIHSNDQGTTVIATVPLQTESSDHNRPTFLTKSSF